MFGFNQGSEVIYQCSTRLTAGSGIGVGCSSRWCLPGYSAATGC